MPRPTVTISPAIDAAQAEWFARLRTLPPEDAQAVLEAVQCGARHGTHAEIPDALLSVDPILAGLWGAWRDTLEAEAWAAVVRLVFIGRKELLMEDAAKEAA
ncbi:MAG: hypothetical protein WB952_08080 [Terriglobales bacterium]